MIVMETRRHVNKSTTTLARDNFAFHMHSGTGEVNDWVSGLEIDTVMPIVSPNKARCLLNAGLCGSV